MLYEISELVYFLKHNKNSIYTADNTLVKHSLNITKGRIRRIFLYIYQNYVLMICKA